MSGRFAGRVAGIGVVLHAVGLLSAATISPLEVSEPLELSEYRVVRAIAAEVRHGTISTPAPSVLYDGTGLTATNPLLAAHGSAPETIWQYPIRPDQYPVSVEFELDGDYLINEMWIWQLQGEGLTDQALQDFDIVMRDAEGNEVGTVEGALDEFKRVGIQPVQRFNAFGECIFLPIPDCVRFIEIRIHSNQGDPDFVGLAEVLFAGWRKGPPVPEPASAGGMGIALLLTVCRRRGRSRSCPSMGKSLECRP